jgi:hypothetical protein
MVLRHAPDGRAVKGEGCTSTIPAVPGYELGWRCEGAAAGDLVVVMRYHDIPVVLPERCLSAVPEGHREAFAPIEPYTGTGDHLHYVIWGADA